MGYCYDGGDIYRALLLVRAVPKLITVTSDETGTFYKLNGKLHREDGPAVLCTDGYQAWYKHGQLHRKDGPAVIQPDGYQTWYQHGEIHRKDGPAIIISGNGDQEWYQHDYLHREDGPAVISPNGYQAWFQHGKRMVRPSTYVSPPGSSSNSEES